MTIAEIVKLIPWHDESHLCSDCEMLLGPDYGCGETTQDPHYCKYAYEGGVEKEDNGMGYWITKCPNYKKIDQKAMYKAWIKSDGWKYIAKRKIEKADYKCERCGSAMNLAVHHITYDHLCHENKHIDDLLVVCKTCHNELHKNDLQITVQALGEGGCL